MVTDLGDTNNFPTNVGSPTLSNTTPLFLVDLESGFLLVLPGRPQFFHSGRRGRKSKSGLLDQSVETPNVFKLSILGEERKRLVDVLTEHLASLLVFTNRNIL